MKAKWIKKEGRKSALLFFNGWGMDENIVFFLNDNSGPDFPYDILHCNDYRDTNLPDEIHQQLKSYDERVIIAWSLGVWAASRSGLRNISQAVAINGTLSPINTFKGISPHIYQTTLDNYCDDSRDRFMRRICGGSSGFKAFEVMAPQRSTEDQKQELITIQKHVLSAYPLKTPWRFQHAIIGGKDLIFTDTAQQRAWGKTAQTVISSMPHLPFYEFTRWQEILSCLD